MSKYGMDKWAYFEDGVIIRAERSCTIRRAVKVRREAEGFRGRVWFRFSDECYKARQKWKW